MYTEIEAIRNKGTLSIEVYDKNNSLKKDFSTLRKNVLKSIIMVYAKDNKKDWKNKDIDKVIKLILQKEEQNKILDKIDDGSRQQSLFGDNSEYIFEDTPTQNLFFLHGAFHIYKDATQYKKITQDTDKALYDKLAEILNDDKQDIVCVFQHTQKIKSIRENEYLNRCYNKLNKLCGNLVLFGSSLADNDNHIFSQINKSKLEKIYISAFDNPDETWKLAATKFPNKDVVLFDEKTVSYEIYEDEKTTTIIKKI